MYDEKMLIGNVQFNKGQVRSWSVKTNSSGKNINTVFMKDGTKIEYPDQQITNNRIPSVLMGRDGAESNPQMGIKFQDFSCGGKVTGTPNKDYYYMRNSNLTVDVAGDGNSGDIVKIVGRDGDRKPSVFTDPGDKEININIGRGPINMNEGLWLPE